MAAASIPDLPEVGVILDKDKSLNNEKNAAVQIRTPPASDQSSHGHRDDDAASSSSLSDLEDDMVDGTTFQDEFTSAGTGAQEDRVSEVEPDRYEGGIPIFTPVRDPFLFHLPSEPPGMLR